MFPSKHQSSMRSSGRWRLGRCSSTCVSRPGPHSRGWFCFRPLLYSSPRRVGLPPGRFLRKATLDDAQNDTQRTRPPYSIPAFFLSILVLTFYGFGYVPFWIAATLFLVGAGIWVKFGKSEDNDFIPMPGAGRFDRIALIGLCAAGIFITLFLHQPDIDDSFYISVATDAHRHPERAIWSTDTVHDDPSLPVFLPIYKAESFEHLVALTAKLLDITCVRAAQTALPIALSVLVVLAWAMLARTIDPRNWFAITLVTIAVALLAGAAKQGPANYTFTRLQQGKSAMVSAVVPILCVYAFRLAKFGGWRNAVMLGMTQIAGVGLSSTAILIGPAVACAVGFMCLPLSLIDNRRRWGLIFARSVLIGMTCIYPLSMALLMRSQMLAITWIAQSPLQPVTEVITHILGDHRQLLMLLAGMVCSWSVAPCRSRALLLAPPLLLLSVMINPLFTKFLQTHIFSPITFWRGLWVMPWLVWSATFICGFSVLVARLIAGQNSAGSRWIAIACGCAVLAIMLGAHPIWRSRNGTHLHFGALAVNEPEYTVAEQVSARTPAGTAALAPELVACWIAVQDERPPLIFVRWFYTQSSPGEGGMEDVRLRNQLGEIAGKADLDQRDLAALLAGVTRYHLGAIVLSKKAEFAAADVLVPAGFRADVIGDYALWIRG